MNKLMIALVAAVVSTSVVTGCATVVTDKNGKQVASRKTLIILQHPETKDTKECKGDPWANWNVYAATEECAKAYESAGYVRIGGY